MTRTHMPAQTKDTHTQTLSLLLSDCSHVLTSTQHSPPHRCATRIDIEATRVPSRSSKRCRALTRVGCVALSCVHMCASCALLTAAPARSLTSLSCPPLLTVLSDRWRRQEYDLWLLEYLDVVVSVSTDTHTHTAQQGLIDQLSTCMTSTQEQR